MGWGGTQGPHTSKLYRHSQTPPWVKRAPAILGRGEGSSKQDGTKLNRQFPLPTVHQQSNHLWLLPCAPPLAWGAQTKTDTVCTQLWFYSHVSAINPA